MDVQDQTSGVVLFHVVGWKYRTQRVFNMTVTTRTKKQRANHKLGLHIELFWSNPLPLTSFYLGVCLFCFLIKGATVKIRQQRNLSSRGHNEADGNQEVEGGGAAVQTERSWVGERRTEGWAGGPAVVRFRLGTRRQRRGHSGGTTTWRLTDTGSTDRHCGGPRSVLLAAGGRSVYYCAMLPGQHQRVYRQRDTDWARVRNDCTTARLWVRVRVGEGEPGGVRRRGGGSRGGEERSGLWGDEQRESFLRVQRGDTIQKVELVSDFKWVLTAEVP